MPKAHSPRHGSMQFWPRVRAKRSYATVKTWPTTKDALPLGFAGYKVGMTQIFVTDNRPSALTKGEDINIPVTIVECPPIRVMGFRCYKKGAYGTRAAAEIWAPKQEKNLARKLAVPKKDTTSAIDSLNPSDFSKVKLIVHTQPHMAAVGKKRPEVFEMGIGGFIKDQLEFAKSKLGQEIALTDVFSEGEYTDLRVITKGKGFQGPVKRFGVAIRQHKSEKTKRGPGSLGGWKAQAHVMYRVAHAGKMGFHQRCEFSKQILHIGTDASKVNPKGGFIRSGEVKTTYALVRGSVGGSKKRLIQFTKPQRAKSNLHTEAPAIISIRTESQQGR